MCNYNQSAPGFGKSCKLFFGVSLRGAMPANVHEFIDEENTMALLINEDCINCDVCEPECPNDAIAAGEDVFIIDPERCTECVGHFDESQCVAVCPADCIVADPAHPESAAQLHDKFLRLTEAA